MEGEHYAHRSLRWANKSFVLSRIIYMYSIRSNQYILMTVSKARKFLKVTVIWSKRKGDRLHTEALGASINVLC